MRFLLDTHLLIWAAERSSRLSRQAASIIERPENELAFSVVSLWEFVIKNAKGGAGFKGDAPALRSFLLAAGYAELPVRSDHAFFVSRLPPIHGDPFDRLLLAQSHVEGMIFLTADVTIARYPGAVLKV